MQDVQWTPGCFWGRKPKLYINVQLGDEKKTHSPPEYEGDVSPATFVSQKGSPFSYVSHFMKMELDNSYTDIVLIVCGFVAGLVDGLSFNAWGSFSSMQTGTYMFYHSWLGAQRI